MALSFLTPEAAAAILGVKPDTVRTWAKAGKIPARRVGRLWRFVEDELKEFGRPSRVLLSTPQSSTPQARIGGAASRSAVEKFASRQAQKSEHSRKSTSASSVAVAAVPGASERKAVDEFIATIKRNAHIED
jgi:excisionase family DNA binding protein